MTSLRFLNSAQSRSLITALVSIRFGFSFFCYLERRVSAERSGHLRRSGQRSNHFQERSTINQSIYQSIYLLIYELLKPGRPSQCCGSGPFFFESGSANPVLKFRIRVTQKDRNRIRETQKDRIRLDPDPT